MKKKRVFLFIILTAFISSIITVAGICFLLELNAGRAANLARLFCAMHFIEDHYVDSVDYSKMIDGAIGGMVHSLGDPHSIYLDQRLYNQIKSDTSGNFGGIGVYMATIFCFCIRNMKFSEQSNRSFIIDLLQKLRMHSSNTSFKPLLHPRNAEQKQIIVDIITF